jgi:thiamine biosynthesis lipoprotein ApbE
VARYATPLEKVVALRQDMVRTSGWEESMHDAGDNFSHIIKLHISLPIGT